MREPKNRIARKRPDHYRVVSSEIVDALEDGRVPWWPDSMWKSGGICATPRNAVSGRAYTGINHLGLLGVAAGRSAESIDPRFCTYKQAKAAGWQVRDGEHGAPGYFFSKVRVKADSKALEPANASGADGADDSYREFWLLKGFTVFHASQIDGIPPLERVAPAFDPNIVVEQMLQGMVQGGLKFVEGGTRDAYSPAADRLTMPARESFESMFDYSHVLVHQLIHATGHSSRLARPSLCESAGPQRDHVAFAREELVAEMASAMICSELGLTYDVSRHAGYIDHWIRAIQEDKKLVFRASGAAAAAVRHLMGLVPEMQSELAQSVDLADALGGAEETAVADAGAIELSDFVDSTFDEVDIDAWLEQEVSRGGLRIAASP